MTRNDKSTFYQPFSMTLVPMRDTGGHWFLTKVTAPDWQPPSSNAEDMAYFIADLCCYSPESHSL